MADPAKCPICGRGISAKYRIKPHVRLLRRRVSRRIGFSDHPLRIIPCPYRSEVRSGG